MGLERSSRGVGEGPRRRPAGRFDPRRRVPSTTCRRPARRRALAVRRRWRRSNSRPPGTAPVPVSTSSRLVTGTLLEPGQRRPGPCPDRSARRRSHRPGRAEDRRGCAAPGRRTSEGQRPRVWRRGAPRSSSTFRASAVLEARRKPRWARAKGSQRKKASTDGAGVDGRAAGRPHPFGRAPDPETLLTRRQGPASPTLCRPAASPVRRRLLRRRPVPPSPPVTGRVPLVEPRGPALAPGLGLPPRPGRRAAEVRPRSEHVGAAAPLVLSGPAEILRRRSSREPRLRALPRRTVRRGHLLPRPAEGRPRRGLRWSATPPTAGK